MPSSVHAPENAARRRVYEMVEEILTGAGGNGKIFRPVQRSARSGKGPDNPGMEDFPAWGILQDGPVREHFSEESAPGILQSEPVPEDVVLQYPAHLWK